MTDSFAIKHLPQSVMPYAGGQVHWLKTAADCPPLVTHWLDDPGSLTRRLQRLGDFRVQLLSQRIDRPRPAETRLLRLRLRQQASVREVLLYVDEQPVVFARSVIPLRSLEGANRVLGRLGNRALGAELFRAPVATREAAWQARIPAQLLPGSRQGQAWGRLSRFRKRGKPLLVMEAFLPALWTLLDKNASTRKDANTKCSK